MTTRRIIPAAQLRAGPAIIIVALSPRSVLGVIDPPARRSDRAAAQPKSRWRSDRWPIIESAVLTAL